MNTAATAPATESPQLIDLTGPDGLRLRLMDRGATWLSCTVPLADGSRREVLVGGPSPEVQMHGRAYLGATVGRYANRIARATLHRDGQTVALTPNAGSPHQLHGGPDGFDRRVWSIAERSSDAVTFTLDSPAGDQGWPGRCQVRVRYALSEPGTIEMTTEATVDAPCPVALTQHSYFNLDAAHSDARTQRLRLAASHYVPVDAELIPTGGPAEVAGTAFDFRRAQVIGSRWLVDEQQRLALGYDHAWLLDVDPAQTAGTAPDIAPAAVLQSADGRLQMSLATTLPALQVYTGQYLHTELGRDGQLLPACAGVAIEPGYLPDSPNHPKWPQPSCWLLPGEVSRHRTVWRFERG